MLINIDFTGYILGVCYQIDEAVMVSYLGSQAIEVVVPIRLDYGPITYLSNGTLMMEAEGDISYYGNSYSYEAGKLKRIHY